MIGEQRSSVAQIFNLLYRRIEFGRRFDIPIRRKFLREADLKSAIQQIANLRYIVSIAPKDIHGKHLT